MMKIFHVALQVLLYLWQLPQNLLGLVLLRLYRPHVCLERGRHAAVYSSVTMRGGISLGRYIIIARHQCTRTTIAHERGHARQSLMLGPLYLLVIGLPSLLWAWLHSAVAPRKSYYWFYTEKWADRLGGVRR